MSRPDHPVPLSDAEKVAAFKVATASFARTLDPSNPALLTEEELTAELRRTMGIFAGCAAPGRMHITWQGASLKIWASWHIHNHVLEKPVFAGNATLAMARTLYGISDPTDRQMSLL